LGGHGAMALELALLRADSGEALTMRGAALDAVVERQRLQKLRPGGLQVLVRAGRVFAVRKLASADLRFDLMLVENALLLVARGDPRDLVLGLRPALVAQATVATAVERADARDRLRPFLGGAA